MINRLQPAIDAELPVIRFVTDVAGLDDHQILAMIRMWPVPIDGHNATHPPMIKWKSAKVLGRQDNGDGLN